MLAALLPALGQIAGGVLGTMDKNKDRAMQKEFAQSGIQWKVEDAKKAGIHPLAALGAQTTSYSPVSVGGPSIASSLAGAGQDISNAIDPSRPSSERVAAYNQTVQDLQVKRMGLENELLASQIAKLRQAAPFPGGDRFLLDGQSNSPLVMDKPLNRVVSSPEAPSMESGAITESGHARTPTGWAPVLSKDYQERTEEDLIGTILWNIRNRLAPTVSSKAYIPPAGVPLADDEVWYYDPGRQEYIKRKRSYRSTMDRMENTIGGRYAF